MLGAAKRQAEAMRSAADHLAFLHAELGGSAAPIYDVPTAFEVLQTGALAIDTVLRRALAFSLGTWRDQRQSTWRFCLGSWVAMQLPAAQATLDAEHQAQAAPDELLPSLLADVSSPADIPGARWPAAGADLQQHKLSRCSPLTQTINHALCRRLRFPAELDGGG